MIVPGLWEVEPQCGSDDPAAQVEVDGAAAWNGVPKVELVLQRNRGCATYTHAPLI